MNPDYPSSEAATEARSFASRLSLCLMLVGISLTVAACSAVTRASGRLANPAAHEAAAAPTEPLAILVRGNLLVSASGRPLRLHGVGVSTTVWACLSGRAFEFPTGRASIAAMVSWHINAVRIPLNEDCWLGINGAPRQTARYHSAIRAYVDRLNADGIYVILDLHWNAPGKVLSHLGPGFAGYYEMADEDHSPAFWRSVASYFRDDHAVVFDLFNEPRDISWDCWLDGCRAPRGYETAGMQQMVDVVRSTGATQPLMIGGLAGASVDGAGWLAHRPVDPLNQVVASVHVYGQSNTDHFDTNIGTVAERVPVVMGEIGEKDCGDHALDVILPWADGHGVSYIAWAWWVGHCSAPALLSNYRGRPTGFGIGYREHLIATFPAPVGRTSGAQT